LPGGGPAASSARGGRGWTGAAAGRSGTVAALTLVYWSGRVPFASDATEADCRQLLL